jgi:hypothetical protein
MRDALALFGRSFGGTDIQATIDLDGVKVEDFATKRASQGQGQGTFPGSGWPDNGDKRRVGHEKAELYYGQRSYEFQKRSNVSILFENPHP